MPVNESELLCFLGEKFLGKTHSFDSFQESKKTKRKQIKIKLTQKQPSRLERGQLPKKDSFEMANGFCFFLDDPNERERGLDLHWLNSF